MLTNEDILTSSPEDTVASYTTVVSKRNDESRHSFSSGSLYSGFNDLFGNSSELEMSPTNGASEISSSDVSEQNISSHLKGTLAFGLPTKGNNPNYKERSTPSSNILFCKQKLHSEDGAPLHRSIVRKKETKKIEHKEIDKPNINHLSEELQLGYRILYDLMADSFKSANDPFMQIINLDPNYNKEYLEVIKEPMWLPKIKEKLLQSEYSSITELIRDIRIMLENAYRFYGPVHSYTKKGLRIEYVMEQKIALLPKEIKELCCLEKTNGISLEEQKEIAESKGAKKSLYGGVYLSHIFLRVKGFRQARIKEIKRLKQESIKQARLNKEMEVVNWEEELVAPHLQDLKAMWELPQIGQFVCLSLSALNIGPVAQYDLERGFIMPEASLTLRMLMTSLVSSPVQRLKIAEKPFMPYNIWARKLANKVALWYRIFYKERKNPKKIFDQLGIDPIFWKVCGEESPFRRFLFHEMTYYQRIWLVKTLCDFIAHNHKSVQDVIMEQPEEIQREEILGTDKDDKEYIYFPQFIATDLRIYKRCKLQYIPEEGKNSDGSQTLPESSRERVFSKDQVKAFRNLLRGIKRKQEKNDDWDRSHRKKKGRKRKLSHLKSGQPTSVDNNEPRTRPGNLRQRPRTRYSEDHILPSEIFDSPVVEESSSENSSNNEDSDGESFENGKKLTRAKTKNLAKKKGKQRPTCNICGKTFGAMAALNGHMSVHSKSRTLKEKDSHSSREGTPRPRREKSKSKSQKNSHFDDTPPEGKGATFESQQQKNIEPLGDNLSSVDKANSNLDIEKPLVDLRCQGELDTKQGDSGEIKNVAGLKEELLSCVKEEETKQDVEKKDFSEIKTEVLDKPSDNEFLQLNDVKKELKIEDIKESNSTFIKSEDSNVKNSEDQRNEPLEDNGPTKLSSSLEEEKMIQTNELNGTSDSNNQSNTKEIFEAISKDNSDSSKEASPESSHKDPIEEVCASSLIETTNQDFSICETLSKKESFNSANSKCDLASIQDDKELANTEVISASNSTPTSDNEDCEDDSLNPVNDCQVLPDPSQFELIATTIDELRSLILQFGPLPKNKRMKDEKERPSSPQENLDKEEKEHQDQLDDEIEKAEETKQDEGIETDSPTQTESKHECEIQLHSALCELLLQLAPFDTKLKAVHKSMRKKLWQEYSELSKKDASYVDPDEEAWLSEPEPEPSPAPPEPKPSSSSSSSEEEYTEDGIRKRKLRKRKVKKLSVPIIDDPLPTFLQNDDDSNDAVTVSSRGRVRRLKKILNYDSIDFDKLALQAEKELIEEKEKKKRKKEEEESEQNERAVKLARIASEKLNLPSSGIKKYVLSKNGRILGYIDDNDEYHAVADKSKKQITPTQDLLSPQRPIHVATRERKPIIIPKTTAPTTISPTLKPKISSFANSLYDNTPTILIPALNKQNVNNGLVYIQINGQQALNFGKMFKKMKGEDPPRQVNLQRSGDTFIFNTDSKILTRNIPEFPDCDLATRRPLTPTKKVPLPTKSSCHDSLKITQTSNSDARIIKSTPETIIPTNTLALAYQGIPGVHSKVSPGIRPQVTSCASLSVSTQLVSASPSVVPSVAPFSLSKSKNTPTCSLTPNVIKTMEAKTTQSMTSVAGSTSLSSSPKVAVARDQASLTNKFTPQPGQKIVAIPNGKGGYNITLITSSPTKKHPSLCPVKSGPGVSPSKPSIITAPTNEISNVNFNNKITNLEQSPSKSQGVQQQNQTSSEPQFSLEANMPSNLSHLPVVTSTQSPRPITGAKIYQRNVQINSSPQSSTQLVQVNNDIASQNTSNRLVLHNSQSGNVSQVQQSPVIASQGQINSGYASQSQQNVGIALHNQNSSGLSSQNQPQIIHIQQPAQQSVPAQQTQQRIFQIVQAGNRQVLQLVQPVIVSENSNSAFVNVPSNTLPQNSGHSTGYLVQPQSPLDQKHSSFMQPRFILQTSPQQPKYVQVAKPEQVLQQTIPNNQVVQQQVIIHQPQTQHIVFQQPSVYSKGATAYSSILQEGSQNSSNQTVMFQPASQLNSNPQTILFQQGSQLETQQTTQQVLLQSNPPLEQSPTEVIAKTHDIGSSSTNLNQNVVLQQHSHTTNIAHQVVQESSSNSSSNQQLFISEQASVPDQNKSQTLTQRAFVMHQPQLGLQQAESRVSNQASTDQKRIFLQTAPQSGAPSTPEVKQISSPKKLQASSQQNGRVLLLQTAEGQKLCYQSSDGQLSLLSAEQIQPLIKNGTIKFKQ